MNTQRISRWINRISGISPEPTAKSNMPRRRTVPTKARFNVEGLEERMLLVAGVAQVIAPSQIPAVGYLQGPVGACTATLISPTHVLTAAHCVNIDGVAAAPNGLLF